jgi:hypothetical protein
MASKIELLVGDDYLLLHVGGIPYYVERSVLLRYPDSFFSIMITSPFKETSDPMITINRDGKLFRYVYDYMHYGTLPRDKNGIACLNAHELRQVEDEAEFYQLPELVHECQTAKTKSIVQKTTIPRTPCFSEIVFAVAAIIIHTAGETVMRV